MAKNNRLINSLKEIANRNREINIQEQGKYVIPIIYAGVALALHDEFGWGHKRINRAFMYSQDLWQQIYDGRLSRETMLEWCEERTGKALLFAYISLENSAELKCLFCPMHLFSNLGCHESEMWHPRGENNDQRI